MAECKKYPHGDHRKRVRDAFRKTGADKMPDRSLIELLLFYAIPRKDTNSIAGALLEKYGSLAGILNAPYDELEKIEGMGESSALLLSVLPEIAKRYTNNSAPVVAFPDSSELTDFIRDKLSGKENETLLMICLDPAGNAINCRIIAQGSSTGVTANKRDILEFAFSCDADSVIIAHNHPKGEPAPSREDIELTKEISRLLGETGIKLRDHIIIGTGGSLSLASTANFRGLFTL